MFKIAKRQPSAAAQATEYRHPTAHIPGAPPALTLSELRPGLEIVVYATPIIDEEGQPVPELPVEEFRATVLGVVRRGHGADVQLLYACKRTTLSADDIGLLPANHRTPDAAGSRCYCALADTSTPPPARSSISA